MTDTEKINLSQLKDKYKKGLLIPEIQRDYVMGAGGKNSAGKDKLSGLLDAILTGFDEKKEFDFSCIITYCKEDDCENNYLEIYDGQQRLTTLTLLVLYKMHCENNPEYRNYADWYHFSGRPVANGIMDMLTGDGFAVDKIEVQDFTSFSMKHLLLKFSEEKYSRITSDYLLHSVRFDRVEIGSQNEIEQFFMDLNSGVRLKEYELYKAKLVQHIGGISRKCQNAEIKTVLEQFQHKLDNEWLNAFQPFASFSHPAEEYEILWLQYCLHMLCKDYDVAETKDEIDCLTEQVLVALYRIMENVSKLRPKNPVREYRCNELLKYSGKYYMKNRLGVFYSLEFEEYEELLYVVIRDVLLKKENKDRMRKDVLLWCYVTTLDRYIDYQNAYLRMIKLLLNHNVLINNKAWYSSHADGQVLYYSKYCVCGVPDYYGLHIKLEETEEAEQYLQDMFRLHAEFIKCSHGQKHLNVKHVSEQVMDTILNCRAASDKIKKIVSERKSLSNTMNYGEYLKKEEEVLGIIDRVQSPVKAGNYLSKVNFCWPTRRGSSSYDDVWVMLKSPYDLLFEDFSQRNDEAVRRFEEEYAKKNTMYDKDKCFWIDIDTACRIHDRASETSTTYAKRDSETEFWAYEFKSNGEYREI